MRFRPAVVLLALLGAAIGAVPAIAAGPDPVTLVARAKLPADAIASAPFFSIPNQDPVPVPVATQYVGGFSALGAGSDPSILLAMPDNGFGNKANSRSFILRVYRVKPDFKTATGGSGTVQILDWINLHDPDKKIPFKIVNNDTPRRILTGGDFDIESFRRAPDGTLWFGDEFGPFLVHTDGTGKVLEAPIPLPDVKSPDFPADLTPPIAGPANLASSNGFEGMALSADGKFLYPTLEGPVTGDDPHIRRMYEFDLTTRKYTDKRRTYRVDDPTFLVSDLTALDGNRLVSLERDNFQGPQAVHKKGFVVSLNQTNADGTLAKREVVNLLDLADPARISLPPRPGDIGIGDPFSMPYQTIEAVLPLGDGQLAIVNDTNFGSTGRNAGQPDYSDFIVIQVPNLGD